MSDDELHALALALIQPQLEQWLAELGKEHEANSSAAASSVSSPARSTSTSTAERAA